MPTIGHQQDQHAWSASSLLLLQAPFVLGFPLLSSWYCLFCFLLHPTPAPVTASRVFLFLHLLHLSAFFPNCPHVHPLMGQLHLYILSTPSDSTHPLPNCGPSHSPFPEWHLARASWLASSAANKTACLFSSSEDRRQLTVSTRA